jgi:hypothetical protein
MGNGGMRAMLFMLVFVAACGGSQKHDEPKAEPKMEMEEEALTPELKDFHDVLAPLWHSDKPTRQDDTCAATPRMGELAGQVRDAGAPAGAAADWDARVEKLADAVVELGLACEGGTGQFDDFFATVHQDFHALMDALPK